MRRSRCLLVAVSAALVVGAFTLTGSPLPAAKSAPAARSASAPSARFLRAARAALVRYLNGGHQAVLVARVGPVNRNGTSAADSYNWSGYADTATANGAFTKAAGSWTTPKIICTSQDTITSEWVGIDGYGSGTVEQDGTMDWCFRNTPTYFTWYEMYPAGTIEVGQSLAPGDKIAASVTRSGTAYTLELTDSTHTADSFTEKATCAASTCLDLSAEWISERPSFAIGIAPLADYGTWTLSGATETAGGKSGTISSYSPTDELSMIDATSSYNLSDVSSLTGGNTFSTTWHQSY
jgi:hypothetical protein